MSGVTSPLTIIVLSIMFVILVGLMFNFFLLPRPMETDKEIEQEKSSGKNIRIDNIDSNGNVILRSMSIAVIDAGSVRLYNSAGDDVTPAGGCPSSDIQPGNTATCTISGTCASGTKIRAVTVGNEDSKICP